MVNELPKWIKWSKVKGKYIIIKDNYLNKRKN